MKTIPKAIYGVIGGSGTWAIQFPEFFTDKDVVLIDTYDSFKTPFGDSAPFKLFRIHNTPILRVATHGWTKDKTGTPYPTWICAQQVAWVFHQAGVRYAITDGSVGGIKNPINGKMPLTPWSVVVPNDFIMHWVPPGRLHYSPSKPHVRMREPFCQTLRNILANEAFKQKKFSVFHDGIYVTTLADRFETEAEIRMYASWGAHIVGQTLGHEAPLMREYGIHFAAINIVSNVAEGHVMWIGNEASALAKFYQECAIPMGKTILNAIKQHIKQTSKSCRCDDYHLEGLEKLPVENA